VVRDQELLTFVVYDVPDDRLRLRVANVCKDFGLKRIQYSAFSGLLDATRRGEMFARLSDTLGGEAGKILMVPVCERDVGLRRLVENEG
jgi:CRISPR-associated protein Cas2